MGSVPCLASACHACTEFMAAKVQPPKQTCTFPATAWVQRGSLELPSPFCSRASNVKPLGHPLPLPGLCSPCRLPATQARSLGTPAPITASPLVVRSCSSS